MNNYSISSQHSGSGDSNLSLLNNNPHLSGLKEREAAFITNTNITSKVKQELFNIITTLKDTYNIPPLKVAHFLMGKIDLQDIMVEAKLDESARDVFLSKLGINDGSSVLIKETKGLFCTNSYKMDSTIAGILHETLRSQRYWKSEATQKTIDKLDELLDMCYDDSSIIENCYEEVSSTDKIIQSKKDAPINFTMKGLDPNPDVKNPEKYAINEKIYGNLKNSILSRFKELSNVTGYPANIVTNINKLKFDNKVESIIITPSYSKNDKQVGLNIGGDFTAVITYKDGAKKIVVFDAPSCPGDQFFAKNALNENINTAEKNDEILANNMKLLWVLFETSQANIKKGYSFFDVPGSIKNILQATAYNNPFASVHISNNGNAEITMQGDCNIMLISKETGKHCYLSAGQIQPSKGLTADAYIQQLNTLYQKNNNKLTRALIDSIQKISDEYELATKELSAVCGVDRTIYCDATELKTILENFDIYMISDGVSDNKHMREYIIQNKPNLINQDHAENIRNIENESEYNKDIHKIYDKYIEKINKNELSRDDYVGVPVLGNGIHKESDILYDCLYQNNNLDWVVRFNGQIINLVDANIEGEFFSYNQLQKALGRVNPNLEQDKKIKLPDLDKCQLNKNYILNTLVVSDPDYWKLDDCNFIKLDVNL